MLFRLTRVLDVNMCMHNIDSAVFVLQTDEYLYERKKRVIEIRWRSEMHATARPTDSVRKAKFIFK